MAQKTTIKVGHLKITDHLVLGVTLDKLQTGKENFQQLDLQAQCFNGWNPLAMAIRENKIDAACILAPLAMELFHVEKKVENSPRLVLFTHKSGSVIITNKRANIEKLEDFRGKTVLIPHFLSIHNLIFDKMLRAKGMSIGVGKDNDVRFEVVAPSEIPEIIEYDEKGTVGGFIVAEPYGSKVVMSGFGEEFALSKDIWPKHPCCVLVVRNEIVEKSPEAVAELVNNLVKSGQFIADDPSGAAEVGAKFLGQDKAVVMHVLTEPKDRVVTDELMPNIADLDAIQVYMTQTIKALSEKVDLGKFVDTRFAKAAGAR